jgi:hypothetical protein
MDDLTSQLPPKTFPPLMKPPPATLPCPEHWRFEGPAFTLAGARFDFTIPIRIYVGLLAVAEELFGLENQRIDLG